jgi:hypothetical protein
MDDASAPPIGATSAKRAMAGAVSAVLCVEQRTKTLPFGQYAMAVRVSISRQERPRRLHKSAIVPV